MGAATSIRVQAKDLRTARRLLPDLAIPTVFSALVNGWQLLTVEQQREAAARVMLPATETKGGAR